MKMITLVKIIHFKYTTKGNFYQNIKYLRWKPSAHNYPDKNIRINESYNIPDEESTIADYLYKKCKFHNILFSKDDILDTLVNKTPKETTPVNETYGRITDHAMVIVKQGILRHVYTWKIEIIPETNLCFIPAVIFHTKNAAHDQTFFAVDGIDDHAISAMEYLNNTVRPLIHEKHTDTLLLPYRKSDVTPEFRIIAFHQWNQFLTAHSIHTDIDSLLNQIN